MYQIPYMILKSQLADQTKAKLIIEGIEVYFEKNRQNNKWTIKASIPFFSDATSNSVLQTLQDLDCAGLKKVQAKLEVYLEQGVAVFVQNVGFIDSYMTFKETVEAFMKLYDFWKSIVEDVIKSESLFAL